MCSGKSTHTHKKCVSNSCEMWVCRESLWPAEGRVSFPHVILGACQNMSRASFSLECGPETPFISRRIQRKLINRSSGIWNYLDPLMFVCLDCSCWWSNPSGGSHLLPMVLTFLKLRPSQWDPDTHHSEMVHVLVWRSFRNFPAVISFPAERFLPPSLVVYSSLFLLPSLFEHFVS